VNTIPNQPTKGTGILVGVLSWCFNTRKMREEFAEKELFPLLCPVIKLTRKIMGDCSQVQGIINPSLVINISKQISEQLSPTAAEAGCYNQVMTVKLFGPEFDKKIQELLDICLQIDCSSAPGAPNNQIKKFEIEPLCRKAEELWGQIVEMYLKKVCVLGWLEKKNRKDQIEIRIKQSVARVPDWNNL
jgi:hypothetical protein